MLSLTKFSPVNEICGYMIFKPPTQFRMKAQIDLARWFVRFSATTLLGFAWLVPKANAGSVTTDFDPNQTLPGIVYGTAATSSTGGDPNGTGTCLQFDTGNGESGLLVLNELDPGLEVQSFVANFDLLMGNGS